MAINYALLKTEIQTDPTGRGYAGKEDNAVAVLLNEVQAGITIRRDNIAPGEILEAIDNRDFTASLSNMEAAWFESVTQLRMVRFAIDDGSDTVVLGNLKRMLQNPGPQGSRARIIALSNRTGSRAEQVLGRNTIVGDMDVAMARQLP